MQRLLIPYVFAICFAVSAVTAAQRADPGDEASRRVPVSAGTGSGQQILAPVEREEFSFVIFADRTTGPRKGVEVLEQAVTMANHLDPAFVMTVGDLVEGYNRPRGWMRQMREYKSAMSKLRMPWYPVAGNHDVYARPKRENGHMDLFKEHFGPLYYSFDYRWAHFICLFSDEHLSFKNPAIDQNMGAEQMQWLREDLASTDAEQIFAFLHHPRWNYRGGNWDDVHRLLAEDGRVTAVIAGHLHEYRDDGVRDGIHYYTLAVTGGRRSDLKDTASIDHINLARVTRDSMSMCVLPVPSVLGADMVLGSEVDEMRALLGGGWMRAEGVAAVSVEAQERSTVTLVVRNPTERAVEYNVKPTAPEAWTLEHGELSGWLPSGQQARLPVRIDAPALSRGVMPALQVRAMLRYPLQSGLVQRIRVAGQVPVQLNGLEPYVKAQPEANKVLKLGGQGAARVDLPRIEDHVTAFTLECWVRGEEPSGRRAMISKTEDSSFGIFWSDPATRRKMPVGYAHVRGQGYTVAQTSKRWNWAEWTHMALVYDGRVLRLFVNGAPAAESPAGRSGRITSNALPLYIGADPDREGSPVAFFDGEIDEVRLSKVARYTSAFKPVHHHETDGDTLLLLHFDGEVAGVVPDDSGHSRHAWLIGDARVSSTDR